MADSEQPRILGVHIAAGVAYMGLLEGVTVIEDAPPKLEPSTHLKDGGRLHDFSARFDGLARALRVGRVVVAKPRRMNKWTFADAFERSILEGCIMLAASQSEYAYTSLSQKTVEAKLRIKMADFETGIAKELRVPDGVHWKHRSVAFAAALAAMKGAL